LVINTYEVLLFGAFLVTSALFSSTETAFTAVNRIRLKKLFETNKSIDIEKVEGLLKHPSKLITALLIGNNFSNVACSVLATSIITDIFNQLNIQDFAITLSIASVTILLLIFGEITPKTLALKAPEKLAVFASRFISGFIAVTYPIVFIFEKINVGISKLFHTNESFSRSLSLDEIKLMVDISHDDGFIEDDKNKLLTNVFEFSDTIVREIMTPRPDAVCLSDQQTVRDAIGIIVEKGHSRIPIYEDKLDNIIGIIYAKDLLQVSSEAMKTSVRNFMRPASFIPEYTPVDDLLQQMKNAKFHLAIVVDEHGGMSGVVTLEDIIEEILGEIQDEYDTDEKNECIDLGNNCYDVDARINITDLENYLDTTFPDDEDFDTLGGFVLSLKGSFPSKNEVVTYNEFDFLVKEIKKRRLIRIEITKNEVSEST
jgi:putative hemolysin